MFKFNSFILTRVRHSNLEELIKFQLQHSPFSVIIDRKFPSQRSLVEGLDPKKSSVNKFSDLRWASFTLYRIR